MTEHPRALRFIECGPVFMFYVLWYVHLHTLGDSESSTYMFVNVHVVHFSALEHDAHWSKHSTNNKDQ